MKAVAQVQARTDHRKKAKLSDARPRMTRRLAEQRAVGDDRKPLFDGTAFLRSLKK
jgi:hypothetical protein